MNKWVLLLLLVLFFSPSLGILNDPGSPKFQLRERSRLFGDLWFYLRVFQLDLVCLCLCSFSFSITKDKVCIGNIKTHNNQKRCLLRWGILPKYQFFNGENNDKPRDFAQDPDPPRCQRLRHGAQRLQPGGPRRVVFGARCDARNDAVGELGQEGVEWLDPIYGEYGLLDHQVTLW